MLERIRNFYGRFERPISSLSLIGGFVFDALTLKRVDMFWENIWVLAHLFIVALFIILIHIQESGAGDEKNPRKAHFWYVNILQFFFGGILSTYLVFYFRSTDILATWPFLLILALAFIANESLKRHYVRFSFQISLFFLSVYSFFIFLVPVLLHRIGAWVFILSGVLSLIFIALFISALFYFIGATSKENTKRNIESKRIIYFLISAIFILINVLYFTNLIPPIPLSLKDAGVYHTVRRNAEGNYDVTYENYGLRGYFTFYKDFHETAASSVNVYSAIFSPKGLNISIVHEWQHYDEKNKKWTTDKVITLPVIGGRDGGFRTFSSRPNLAAGKWRVNIKTTSGQIIGHVQFNIVPSLTLPSLSVETKY